MKKLYLTLVAVLCAFCASATNIYIVGSGFGWDPTQAVELTQGDDGVYRLLNWNHPGGTFKLSTAKGSWDEIFNPDGINLDGTNTPTVGTTYKIVRGWSGDINLAEGHYNLAIDLTANTFLVTNYDESENPENPENPVEETPAFYLRGAITGWNVDQDYKFAYNEDDDVYTLALDALSGNFKISGSDWDKGSYGLGGAFELGTEYNLSNDLSSGDIATPAAWIQNAVLTIKVLDDNNITLSITGVAVDTPQLWLVGNLESGSWAKGGNPKFIAEGNGIYILDDATLMDSGNGLAYFAIATADAPNVDRYGTTNEGSVIENPYADSFTTDKGAWTVAPGTYDIEFNYNTRTVTFNHAHAPEALELLCDEENIVIADGKITGKVLDSSFFTITINMAEGHSLHYYIEGLATPAENGPAKKVSTDLQPAEGNTITLPAGQNVTLHLNTENNGLLHRTMMYDVNVDAVTTGIEQIAVDGAEAEYFNLQGVRVANPAAGMYIIVRGGKATKTYIR